MGFAIFGFCLPKPALLLEKCAQGVVSAVKIGSQLYHSLKKLHRFGIIPFTHFVERFFIILSSLFRITPAEFAEVDGIVRTAPIGFDGDQLLLFAKRNIDDLNGVRSIASYPD